MTQTENKQNEIKTIPLDDHYAIVKGLTLQHNLQVREMQQAFSSITKTNQECYDSLMDQYKERVDAQNKLLVKFIRYKKKHSNKQRK